MHRFYLSPEQVQQARGVVGPATLELSGSEARHASHVLRLRQGERVMVLDGEGHEFFCDVERCAPKHVRLRVVEEREAAAPLHQITLLQALPKGKTIESIVQRATELGVFRIVPLVTERVVAQLDDKAAGEKARKWQGVAVEAIKQCGLARLPRVETPLTPAVFLARGEPFDLPLVASLHSGSKHAREYFSAFEVQRGHRPRSLCIWIGPEGDFTDAEMGAIQAGGALPITLGPLVLRVETAAICCLSILNYELQAPSR